MAVYVARTGGTVSQEENQVFSTDKQGRTVCSSFPKLTFACRKDAEKFCARIVASNKRRSYALTLHNTKEETQ